MVSINFDFQRVMAGDLLSALTEEVRGTLAKAICVSARNRWAYLAARKLSRASAITYVQALQEVVVNGNTATVVLLGEEANRIENGQPGRDLRDTLLGPNVPVVAPRQGLRGMHQSKKGGYYRSIPFRHQGAGSLGSFGAPMGSAYASGLGKEGARSLGKAIYRAAKDLAGSHTEPFRTAGAKVMNRRRSAAAPQGGRSVVKFAARPRKTIWGGRLAPGVNGVKKLMDHHSTDIYAGMVRMEKTYQGATQSSYMTFRTISTNKTTGWMTKPTEGAGLMKRLADELPAMGKEVIDAFVDSIAPLTGGEGEMT